MESKQQTRKTQKMLSWNLQFITGYRKWKKNPPHNIYDVERILKDTNIARAQNTQKIKEKNN